jgi:hypothetical protein
MTISAFPKYMLHNIPEALRAVANQISAGDIPMARCVLVFETDAGEVSYRAFGDEPFTRAHAIGMCFAIAKAIAPACEEMEDRP